MISQSQKRIEAWQNPLVEFLYVIVLRTERSHDKDIIGKVENKIIGNNWGQNN
jgi:hypothetical protein